MNTFDFVCGAALLPLGAYTAFAPARAPRAAVGAGATTMTAETASLNARTQRLSGAALAFLGACLLVDAFGLVPVTLAELGLAALFGAGAREGRLDLRRLRDAGVPESDRTLRSKKWLVALGGLGCGLWVVVFVVECVGLFLTR